MILGLTITSFDFTLAWVQSPLHYRCVKSRGCTNTQLRMDPTAASLIAGSVAGAVGVGVAFPLDTIKTKQQIISSDIEKRRRISVSLPSSSGSATVVAAPLLPDSGADVSMMDVAKELWETQGLPGFFGGVQTSMIGQAIIKSVAFCVNTFMLSLLSTSTDLSEPKSLIAAAATAGFVTAFLAVPCDRVKVLMQAGHQCTLECDSEWDCLQAVLRAEGWQGLLSKGLGPTLLREVPAYTVYFATYGMLLSQVQGMIPLPSFWCGAMAGALCVVPSYPADVVKTIVQNSRAGDYQSSITTWQVIDDLSQQGMGAFWEGLTPRMLRASVNHAVTFLVFDVMVKQLNLLA